MPINYHADRLIKALEERALSRDIIERIIDSGYILRDWGGRTDDASISGRVDFRKRCAR